MAKPPQQAAWIDPLGRWIRPAATLAPKSGSGGRLALGLQGGGALGAFTWGVLDRLLGEPDLPLRALVEGTPPDDLLVVQLNPIRYDGLPKTPRDIAQRLNQVVFNRPLTEEWASLEPEAAAGRFRLHRLVIEPDKLPPGGALDLDWNFLEALRDQGWAQAEAWLRTRAATAGNPSKP